MLYRTQTYHPHRTEGLRMQAAACAISVRPVLRYLDSLAILGKIATRIFNIREP